MAHKLIYTVFTIILLANAVNTLTANLTTTHLHAKTPIVIDSFTHPDLNDIGFWHGPGENLHVEYGQTSPDEHHVRLYPTDPDQNYHTQLSAQRCTSMTTLKDHFLHVVFSGPATFSISLNQNNVECLPGRKPYPATWDTVEAGRYTKAQGYDQGQGKSQDAYVPLSHFNIDLSRVVSVSFSGFTTKEPVTLRRIEVVKILPAGNSMPVKLANGNMVLRCARPNSFAFGIDDGQPWLAKQVMDILAEENVLVTFFAVGNGLRNRETNLTEVYREMLRRGHQIGLHSNTHRKMEGLKDEDIDDEIRESIEIFHDNLGIETQYFRPPYGTVGARLRQHLAATIHDPYIINWSVDVEDWLWAATDAPERQLDAFARDLRRGGNLVVMHYLYPSTVAYFRQFIHMVKASGLHIMRVDQCLEDPRAPPV